MVLVMWNNTLFQIFANYIINLIKIFYIFKKIFIYHIIFFFCNYNIAEDEFRTDLSLFSEYDNVTQSRKNRIFDNMFSYPLSVCNLIFLFLDLACVIYFVIN